MLRSIGNSLCGVSLEEEKEGYSGKDLQKRKDLSLEKRTWGVMDDESGESMKLDLMSVYWRQHKALTPRCDGYYANCSAPFT